jgi:predicted RNase H-like HicB family nuclease
MIKLTYPIIFIENPETGEHNGYIPDLAIFADGYTAEEVYAEMEEILYNYMVISIRYEAEVPGASSLDEIVRKWPGYKVSLITTIIK